VGPDSGSNPTDDGARDVLQDRRALHQTWCDERLEKQTQRINVKLEPHQGI
jgi:hypothetical protein